MRTDSGTPSTRKTVRQVQKYIFMLHRQTRRFKAPRSVEGGLGIRLRDKRGDSQRAREGEATVRDATGGSTHAPANGVTRDMAATGSDRDATEQEKA